MIEKLYKRLVLMIRSHGCTVSSNELGPGMMFGNEQVIFEMELGMKSFCNLKDRVLFNIARSKGFRLECEIFKNHGQWKKLMAEQVAQLRPGPAL